MNTKTLISTAISLAALAAAGPAVAAPPTIASVTAEEGDVVSVPITHTCKAKKGCQYALSVVAGTASDATDLTPFTLTYKVKKGKTFKTILPISTTEDEVAEPTESFFVHVDLTNNKGTTPYEAAETITDDDKAPAPPPPDDNTPVYESFTGQRDVKRCTMPFRYGNNNEGGAWGAYLSGCTVDQTCQAARCVVWSPSGITPEKDAGQRLTLNTRLWVTQANGATAGNYNNSCDTAKPPCAEAQRVYVVKGQTAHAVCNGVRAINPSIRAQVLCAVVVEPY